MTFVASRLELQRVAVHVLSRERFQRAGRIGLRQTPGGFGSDVLRVDGTSLVGPDGSCPIRSLRIGASPGDDFSEEPYLYVGPWGDDRPGDSAYWNAPFGAIAHTTDREEALAFYRRGVTLLQI